MDEVGLYCWRHHCTELTRPRDVYTPTHIHIYITTLHIYTYTHIHIYTYTLLRCHKYHQASSHWVPLLREANIPCGPINSVRAVLEDEHVKARGMAIGHGHGQDHGHGAGAGAGAGPAAAGAPPILNSPVKYSRQGYASATRLPPPLLGEHTEEVLREVLGKTAGEIESLREAGAVA